MYNKKLLRFLSDWKSLGNDKITQNLIDLCTDKIQWNVICEKFQLSEEFISEYANEIDWIEVCKHQKLTLEFVTKFSHRMIWDIVLKRTDIPKINQFDYKLKERVNVNFGLSNNNCKLRDILSITKSNNNINSIELYVNSSKKLKFLIEHIDALNSVISTLDNVFVYICNITNISEQELITKISKLTKLGYYVVLDSYFIENILLWTKLSKFICIKNLYNNYSRISNLLTAMPEANLSIDNLSYNEKIVNLFKNRIIQIRISSYNIDFFNMPIEIISNSSFILIKKINLETIESEIKNWI